MSLLDSLHCWSLLESESFLWLVSTFYDNQSEVENLDQSDRRINQNQSEIIIRPNRCGSKNTNYVFFRHSDTPSRFTPQSKCFYFTGSDFDAELEVEAVEAEITNWEECYSCDMCPPSLFFKIERNQEIFEMEISSIHLAVGIAVTILVMLAIVILITR